MLREQWFPPSKGEPLLDPSFENLARAFPTDAMPAIEEILSESVSVTQAVLAAPNVLAKIRDAADRLIACARAQGTIFSCGNGGSTCDAMHLTEELVARYKRDRPGIRAMHLMDAAVLSCWSNDYSFEGVFARQIETFARKGDLLVALSTSGNSKNVLAAVTAAKAREVTTIALTGKDGGALAPLADIAIVVPSQATERIQEVHLKVIHIFCELMERELVNGTATR